MKRAVITGGTGVVGRALLSLLLQAAMPPKSPRPPSKSAAAVMAEKERSTGTS